MLDRKAWWAMLCGAVLLTGTTASEAEGGASYGVVLQSKDGTDLGSWSKVDGLGVSWDVVEHDGESRYHLRKRPGRAKLMLTGGAASGSELLTWEKLAASSKKTKKSLVLTVLDSGSGPCTFQLGESALERLEKRKVTAGDKQVTVVDVVIAPGKISHTCGKLFVHPRDRKKKK